MRLWKKLAIGAGAALVTVVIAFVIVIGPWPVSNAGFEGTPYYQHDLAAIDKAAQTNMVTDTQGRLQAGWGVALMNPDPGTPMAGYGARQNVKEYLFGDKPKGLSTGVHDDLHVKALAFSDGKNVAVIVGADMLIIPPNIADAVRAEVAKQTPLTANSLYFGASHTHDGPGGFADGFAAFMVGGKYNPKVPALLTSAFTSAIVEAYHNLGPAKMAHGGVDVPEYVRNRAHKDGIIDPRLSYLVVEKDDGKRCVLVNYSAHPTIVGSKFLEFTAEYPGFLQAAAEKALPNTTVEYLGGALGSSGPKAPEGGADIERSQAMGEALAKILVAQLQDLKFVTNGDVAAVGVPIELPPFQMRITPKLRVSPMLAKMLNVPHEAWMHVVRVGDVVFVGAPGDLSCEISVAWKQWASNRNIDLWTSSFCAAYAGYISPDKYYNEPGSVREYETGAMSWTGPHQEAFFTALMQHMFDAVRKPSA